MDSSAVIEIRRFNRIVTQRVGALNDHFLARNRPLAEARLLWEIGNGRDLRSLRAQLGLDSGYLSRLLRSLEGAGLIIVDASSADRRVRIARPTRKGLTERAVLDKRSDELAVSFLAPLTETQKERMVSAMAEVARLLTAASVEVRVIDPDHPHARYCLQSYFSELNRRFDAGFDPFRSIPADAKQMRPPAGVFLVAMLGPDPIGCGAVIFHEPDPPYIKRMWVADGSRGLGVGRRLLGELEAQAARRGARAARLETNKSLTEAISLYRSSGYVEVAPFNDEPYAHHWFVKQLGGAGAESKPQGEMSRDVV